MPPAITENRPVLGCRGRHCCQCLWGCFSTLDLLGALELPGVQQWVVGCHPPETCRSTPAAYGTGAAVRHLPGGGVPVWGSLRTSDTGRSLLGTELTVLAIGIQGQQGKMGVKTWRRLTGTRLTTAPSERERARSWMEEGIEELIL